MEVVYTLAELVGQCDLKAAPPADLALWDAAKPVGRECIPAVDRAATHRQDQRQV